MKEQQLYHPICCWLTDYLQRMYPRALSVIVEDTSRLTVATFLERNNLLRWIPVGDVFDIKVDITGAVVHQKKNKHIIDLAIVEVKVCAISLRDFSQILGYSRVVIPKHSFIISPEGWSSTLQHLIRDYKRVDILEYSKGKQIVVAKWDLISNSVRSGDVLIYNSI